MPQVCRVCAHAERATIDAALAAGNALRDIAGRFGVTKDALSRHGKAGHTPPAPTPPAKRDAPPEPRQLVAPTHNPKSTAPRTVEAALLEAEAVKLRIRGKDYDEIGAELGVTPDGAFKAVERAIERARETATEDASTLREIELKRCDAIIDSFWDRATDASKSSTTVLHGRGENAIEAAGYDPSQDKAAATLLKAMERRAALLGLDAAGAKVNVTIVQDPAFQAATRAIFEALAPFPEARAAVVAKMRSALAARRAEVQLVGG